VAVEAERIVITRAGEVAEGDPAETSDADDD